MASGSFTLTNTGATSRYVQINVDWSSRWSNLSENTSYVDIIVNVVKLQGSTQATSGKYNMTISVDSETMTIPNTNFSVSPRSSLQLANVSIPVRHNADGTKSCTISVNVGGNVMWANGSQYITLDTIPRYVSLNTSVGNKTETSLTMNWFTDRDINKLWYSINNGSSYTELSASGTSGSFAINGLTPNTMYPIIIKVRAADSGLDTTSSTTNVYTYNYPTAQTSNNIVIGDDSVNVSFYNPLSREFSYTLKDANGGTLGTGTISGTSASIDISTKDTQLYNSIPNAKIGAFTCVCTTTINNIAHTTTATIGSYSVVEADCIPTLSGITIIDTNNTTTSMTGDNTKIVSGYSQNTITANGISVKNGATISSVNAYLYGINEQPINLTISGTSASASNIVISYSSQYSPNKNIYIVVEDSRGITQTFTYVMNVFDYTPVWLSSYYAKRQSNYYSETDFFAKVEITQIGTNTSQLKVRYRKVGDSTWGNWVNMTSNVIETITLDNNYAWQYEMYFADNLTNRTINGSIQRGIPLMYIDTMNNRVGINCFPENLFEVEKAPVNTNFSDSRVACGLLDGNFVYRQCEYGDVADVIDFNDRSMYHLIPMINEPKWITDVVVTTYDTDGKKFRKITPTNVQYLNSSLLVLWEFPSDLDEWNSKYLIEVKYTISVG